MNLPLKTVYLKCRSGHLQTHSRKLCCTQNTITCFTWSLINQKLYNRALQWLSYYVNMPANKWENQSMRRVYCLVNGQNHQYLKIKKWNYFLLNLRYMWIFTFITLKYQLTAIFPVIANRELHYFLWSVEKYSKFTELFSSQIYP